MRIWSSNITSASGSAQGSTTIIPGSTFVPTTATNWILANATASTISIMLPTTATAGQQYGVKKSAGAFIVTVGSGISGFIEGGSLFVLRTIRESYQFINDGANNWNIFPRPMNEVPVGSVIAFLVSFSNIPALPAGFVACNGQTLADTSSVFNAAVIPNLNASGGGSQRFLRGSTASGGTGGSDTVQPSTSTFLTQINYVCTGSDASFCYISSIVDNPVSDLPSYYQVQWIMRVK